jgi:hypothetical protein
LFRTEAEDDNTETSIMTYRPLSIHSMDDMKPLWGAGKAHSSERIFHLHYIRTRFQQNLLLQNLHHKFWEDLDLPLCKYGSIPFVQKLKNRLVTRWVSLFRRKVILSAAG